MSEYLRLDNVIFLHDKHEMRTLHDINIPLIVAKPLVISDGTNEAPFSLGEQIKWIRNNVQNEVYVLTNSARTDNDTFSKCQISFSNIDDYAAFKLVFPELCR